MQHACPIWGTQAELLDQRGAKKLIASARAGGRYWITDTAAAILRSWPSRDWRAVALTEEIYLANRSGATLAVDSRVLEGLKLLKPLSALDQFRRFLQLIADFHPEVGDYFDWTREYSAIALEILAAVRASAESNYGTARMRADLFFVEAIKAGYLIRDPASDHLSRISTEGWEHIESLAATGSGKQIFVAMWFGTDEQTRLWKEGIEPGIIAAGYTPLRIDNKAHNGKIDDQIIAEIRKSRAVIVDMTCGLAKPLNWSSAAEIGAPRGGVYYEAGYAMGLGLPVIWTVKNDIADVENVVHFDIRQYAQIRWRSDQLKDFAEKLRYRIEATLGRGLIS